MTAGEEHNLVFTSEEEIEQCTADLAATFEAGLTRPIEFRKKQLRQLIRMFDECRDQLAEAVHKDLRKHKFEAVVCELALLRDDAARALANIDRWAATEYPSTRITFWMTRPSVRKVPYGMVLVIGPWNYPMLLLLKPFIGAIAAGNTVALKPSELSPHSASMITELLPRYLDSRAYRIVNGDATQCTQLLKTKFDYIFYTGSGTVGRIVMRAAAEQLTPVTLELGGKSPTILHESCDVDLAAARIFFSKFLNCGQTCIAPDYVFCPRELIPKLVEGFKAAYASYYGGDASTSASYSRMINHRHYDRVHALIEESIAGGAEVLLGGGAKREDKYLEPTALRCKLDDPLMREEIFGPVLPIIELESIDKTIAYINRNDQPLALYIFCKDKKVTEHVINSTRSGGVCINDTIFQFIVPDVPFGGCGQSGMGRYQGKHTFDTFTHQRSVIRSLGIDEPIRRTFLYPPFSVDTIPLSVFSISSYTGIDAKLKLAALMTGAVSIFAYLAISQPALIGL
ncbi:aldehyde dehydrogenase [Thamnocephalis sphaerospora]|uniref:Aldehyde dehydrogenase n=1 Tax=Thamnocephalis sphaerospora TaxID=78915 RepID=A0A4P9XPS7_9FUNG|nr:aldehyde dehydrogenase [Thamnocephalis sphaerospora]|eukprot:RKP08025.1 aldehyde dehydrogenase [Thamnocephalis sphaerospora]